ncbi:MAG: AI-2E family transporter [Thermoleophilia bacterium]|nr:AI-2E family transporter [Thermoleophilia bacterium]
MREDEATSRTPLKTQPAAARERATAPPSYVAVQPRTVVQITAIVLAMIWLAQVIEQLQGIFVIMLVGAFIAIAVDPLVRLLMRTGLTRGAAVALVLVTFFSSIATLGLALGNVLASQTSQFASRAPRYVRDLTDNPHVRHLERRYDIVNRLVDQLQNLPVTLAQAVPDIATALASTLLLLITMVALVTFLLLDGHKIASGIVAVFPRMADENNWAYVRIAYRNVSRYVAGTTLESLISGVALALAMTFFHVPFALPMALLVFVLNYIPKIGSFLGMLPAIGLAFAAVGPGTGVAMTVFVIVFQQIDGSFIYPNIMGRVINLSPMFVFLAALIGAQLLGVVGAVVAIPTAAVVHVALREYFAARNTGVDVTVPPLHIDDGNGDGHVDASVTKPAD